MFARKNFIYGGGLLGLLGALALAQSAFAGPQYYTAQISGAGEIIRQSPIWLDRVDRHSSPAGVSEYTLNFTKGSFQQKPGYCSMTLTDLDKEYDVFYAKGRVGGTPSEKEMKVYTYREGSPGESPDPKMSFMVMCVQ